MGELAISALNELDIFVLAASAITVASIAFSAVITLILCHFAMPIGKALHLLDEPDSKSHALHQHVTPLVGGIAILAPVILGSFAVIALTSENSFPIGHIVPLWFVSTFSALLVLGSLDDRFHLSPRLRLTAMVVVYGSAIALGRHFVINALTFPVLGLVIHLGVLGLPLTILCLVALTNAINMADGRNGLVIGMSIIWCTALILTAWPARPTTLEMLLASLCIGFVYNLRGRLFLGDGGAYGLAFCLGMVAIWAHNRTIEPLATPQVASLFIIPVMDMARLIVTRLKHGRSPMAPDNDHLHHRLERCVGWRVGLPVYLMMVAAPIGVAFTGPKMGVLGLFLAVAAYVLTWLKTRGHLKQPQESCPGPEGGPEPQLINCVNGGAKPGQPGGEATSRPPPETSPMTSSCGIWTGITTKMASAPPHDPTGTSRSVIQTE